MKRLVSSNKGYYYAIFAAILFGASTPSAKTLIGQIHPWLLAGLLYLGSSFGLIIISSIRRYSSIQFLKEASLTKRDWKWLLIAVIFGGILSPVLLMLGLARISGSVASLLLNLESVFTALIAWVIFKEFVDKRLVFGMLLIVIGSFILSWPGVPKVENFIGILFIAGSCLLWGIDNNVTRKISASDPLNIALVKCLIAGITNTCLAFLWIRVLPTPKIFIVSIIVGFIGYGLSLYFYVLGLRYVGAARTGAYFSIAPFIGAILAIICLNESITIQFIFASILMWFGIYLHLTEHHEHEHTHEELEHSHLHTHDEHHEHQHIVNDPKGEPHTHLHKHNTLRHKHPHYPDIHHQHKH